MVVMLVAAGLAVGANIVVPLAMQRVIDGPVKEGNARALPFLGGAVLALGVAEAVLIFIRRWIQAETAVGVEAAIRNDLYAHLQRLSITFHDRWQIGQLLSRVTTDLGVIRRLLGHGVVFLLVNIATYATVAALLIHLYWPLGLVVAGGAVPLLLLSRSFARTYLKASRLVQEQRGDLASTVEEAAGGIRVIKAFGRARHVYSGFDEGASRLHDTAVNKARLAARFSALYDLIPGTTLAIVVVVGAIAVAQRQLTLGELVAFVALQLMLVSPVKSLGTILALGQEGATAADRLFELFDTEPDIVDRPTAVPVPIGDVRGQVRLEGVTFGYPGSEVPVLVGVDLEVSPGETLAIVGATGSGKTTLVSLVPRLRDVSAGAITIDGRDVRDYTLSSLRRVVASAFEEPTLFSMSVRENLTLGRPDATDDDIAEALRVARAEFVYQLPWGLDTRVGEQGMSLSGGQRQRLALARAVIVKPRVLVLDDPLSALDVHTEAQVEKALARVLADTTALVVAHRPSTVALADRVALLADGRIAAIGTHAQLLATVPSYRSLLSQGTNEVGDAELAGGAQSADGLSTSGRPARHITQPQPAGAGGRDALR